MDSRYVVGTRIEYKCIVSLDKTRKGEIVDIVDDLYKVYVISEYVDPVTKKACMEVTQSVRWIDPIQIIEIL